MAWTFESESDVDMRKIVDNDLDTSEPVTYFDRKLQHHSAACLNGGGGCVNDRKELAS